MLHVDRAQHPASEWALKGFPPRVRPDDLTDHLWWVLTDLAAAADAGDTPAVSDLVAVAGVLADLLITRHPARPGGGAPINPVSISVVLELYGDLQRAIGAGRLEETALHAVTMRRLMSPPPPQRSPDAIPAYVPPAERLGPAGRVSLVTTGERLPAPVGPAEDVLIGVARLLVSGLGHLADRHSTWCPAGCTPARVGWLSHQQPRGERLGVISLADGQLVLDPPLVVDLLASVGVRAGSTDEIGRLLAERWLTDSTLLVTQDQVRRIAGVAGVVEDGEPAGWTWHLSTELWAAGQFTTGPETVPPLHLVPNTDG